MNVLVINGSPKGERSNTWKLTQAFLRGMEKQLGESAIEVRTVVVRDASIKPCLGCFSCWKSEQGTCCLHDDMAHIIESRVWADVCIWSFPLYYFTVPGPLKNLIDRQLPMTLPFMVERADGLGSGSHPSRYNMAGKRNVIISTCGFYSAKGNYDGVFSLFDHMCGKGNYDAVLCGQGELFRVPELAERTNEYLRVVEQAGTEYASGGIAPSTAAELECLLYSRETFEAMADASWGRSRDTGEAEDESIAFTRQMAALYNPASFDGKERVIQFNYTDRGTSCCVVLGQKGSRVVTDGSVYGTTCIDTPYTVWCDIAQGKISGSEAMMQHLYTVSGDFDVMLNWNTYFGATSAQKVQEHSKHEGGVAHESKPTTMLAMLVPWIVFWIAMPIFGALGPVVSLVGCAITPLVFWRNQKTPYDVLSIVCVTVLVAASLAGVANRVLLPVSYGVFGLFWLVSTISGIPLSAHYSKNSYGGDAALSNALFLKTNQIICVVWGVTYILAALAALLLTNTGLAPFVALVNNILPIPAAVFTLWFQKWYPQRVARG